MVQVSVYRQRYPDSCDPPSSVGRVMYIRLGHRVFWQLLRSTNFGQSLRHSKSPGCTA